MTPPLKPLADDASLAVEAMRLDRYRRLECHEKLAIVFDLDQRGEGIALPGIRERHPHASEEEQRLRLFALKHGRALAPRVFGWDPLVEGR